MHQTLTQLNRIIQLMEDDRRARNSFVSVNTLLSELAAAACAGRWAAAQQTAGTLQQLFGGLEERGQPGLDELLFPSPSLETHLMGVLESLGYPTEDVESLRGIIRAQEANPEEIRRETLRAELVAFGNRTAGRDELLLESLTAGISEAETSRLSRLARGTVRAVRSRANDETPAPEQLSPAVLPETVLEQRAPTIPAAVFRAPAYRLV